MAAGDKNWYFLPFLAVYSVILDEKTLLFPKICWKEAPTNHLLLPTANRSSIEEWQQWSDELDYEKCHVYGWGHFFVTHGFCYFSHNFWPKESDKHAERDRLTSTAAPQHGDIYTFGTNSTTPPNKKLRCSIHPARSGSRTGTIWPFLPAEPGGEMKGKSLPLCRSYSRVYALSLPNRGRMGVWGPAN